MKIFSALPIIKSTLATMRHQISVYEKCLYFYILHFINSKVHDFYMFPSLESTCVLPLWHFRYNEML